MTVAAGVLDKLGPLTDAPDTVPLLRKLIIDLAIRGKLLDMNRQEESPAEILELIEEKRRALVRKGKLKKDKPLPPITDDELPAHYSDLCTFERLAKIAILEKGPTAIQKCPAGPFPLVTTSDTRSTADHFDFEGKAAIIPLVSSTGHGNASLKRLHYQDGRFSLGNILCGAFPVAEELISARFIYEYLTAYKEELLVSRMTGTANVTLTVGRLGEIPIPIISPAAQAKIDELMALCDRLEAAKAERERRRDKLVMASLHGLRKPAEAHDRSSTSGGATTLYLRKISRLVVRPEHVQRLRGALRDLSVRGLLGARAADWPEEPSPLRDVATLQNGYAFKSEWFVRTGTRLLRNVNIGHGTLRWDDMACLSPDRVQEFERFRLNDGDIVLSLDRPLIATGLKVARVREQDLPALLLQRVGRFQYQSDRLYPDFLFLWLTSHTLRARSIPDAATAFPTSPRSKWKRPSCISPPSPSSGGSWKKSTS